jgi:hypothetical protein
MDFNLVPLLVLKVRAGVVIACRAHRLSVWACVLTLHPLSFQFLNVPAFHNVALQCLTEIAGLQQPEMQQPLLEMFHETMKVLTQMLPPTTDMRLAYHTGSDHQQRFVQNLSLFLATFLREHCAIVELPQMQPTLAQALHYLLLVSEVDDIEIFKVCLEYWNFLAGALFNEACVRVFFFFLIHFPHHSPTLLLLQPARDWSGGLWRAGRPAAAGPAGRRRGGEPAARAVRRRAVAGARADGVAHGQARGGAGGGDARGRGGPRDDEGHGRD